MLVSKSFTAAAQLSDQLTLPAGKALDYAVSGTFVATLVLEYSVDGGMTWRAVVSITGAASATVVNESPGDQRYRLRCSAYTSGTAVTTMGDANLDAEKRVINAAGQAKAGATAGWVVAAGDNVALITCPQSQTASTLVVPIPNLKVGEKITGFHLIGQIESAGGTVTVDAALRKHTAAAADVADAAVASITQLSVTADTAMSESNTRKASLDVVVAEDATYYMLITATTDASTDIALQGIALEVVAAP